MTKEQLLYRLFSEIFDFDEVKESNPELIEEMYEDLKEYTQQIVDNALKAASEKATASNTGWHKKGNHIISGTTYINKESILTAYKVE